MSQQVLTRQRLSRLLVGPAFPFALACVLLVVPSLSRLRNQPLIGPDPFVYEYGGWLLSTGRPPYEFLWDVKPPGVFYFSAVFSLVSGGNPLAIHWLSILLNMACVLLAVYFSFVTVRALTGSAAGGVAAGMSVLGYPAIYLYAATGTRPKYLCLALLFGAFYAWSVDHPYLAFALSMVLPALWQPMLIVPLVVGTLAIYDRPQPRRIGQLAAIGGAVVVIAVGPIVALGAGREMIQQTVVAPLMHTDPTSPLQAIRFGGRALLFAAPVALAGGGTAIWAGIASLRAGKVSATPVLIAVVFVWFALYATFVDLDWLPDLLVVSALCAPGVGLLVARFNSRAQLLLVVVVVGLVLANAVALQTPLSIVDLPAPLGAEGSPSIDPSLLFETRVSETCHIRLSQVEQTWIAQRGSSCN